MTKVLMCLFIVCETKFYVESRTISHANETQAQQVQNLAQEHFPPKLLWNENADFKFSVNNEGEDVNKKPRSRENIAQHSEGNATNKRQRNRRLESDALLMIVLHCGKPRYLSLPVSPPMYRSTSAKLQFSFTARSIIIFRRTALPYLFFVFAFF